MKSWILLGLMASFCWGSFVIVNKVALRQGPLSPFLAALAMGGGAVVCFGAAALMARPSWSGPPRGLWLSGVAGAIWALGMICMIAALSRGADVARLTPLYNTNTLVAVLLGLLVLKETPADAAGWVRLLVGAFLVTAGGVLVAR
jgi:transporter family protein